MRKFFLISSAAVSLFAVGCTSPEAVCKSGIDLACERAFECQSNEVKSTEQFKTAFGASAEECKTKQYAAAKCEDRKEYDEACTDGKKYNLSKASDCSDAKAAQTCTDYMDATKTPAACKEICG
jgi:hypothetical protein